jgi:membrane protein implicated in regulation of membrane protease activity
VSDWQLWIIAGIALLIAEVTAPGFWLLSVAVGCFTAAVAGFLPFGLVTQVLAFAAGTVLSAGLLRPFLLRRRAGHEVRTNVDALIGKTGVVVERIDSLKRTGRVIVDGEDWRGASLDDVVIEAGTRITVVAVDGATLKVDPEALLP